MLTLSTKPTEKPAVKIAAPFFQAGLAGYSDAAMRRIAREHGAPLCVTEALLDQILISGGKGLSEARPQEGDHGADTPLVGQLMGSFPDEMVEAANLLVDLGYDVVDLNLACPVKKIRKRSRGGHLLSVPDEAEEILRVVMAGVGHRVPLTVKLRRSYDDTPEMVAALDRIFSVCMELGYAGAVVHGRTVRQKYIGPSSWEDLAALVDRHGEEARQRNFVIGGSGDIWTAEDIFRMIDQTGVSLVSVARGCIGNPWVFRQARDYMQSGDKADLCRVPSIHQQRDVLLRHFELSAEIHGEDSASRMMRKFGIRFSRMHPEGDEIRQSFIRVKSLDQWREVLTKWYETDGPGAKFENTLPPEAAGCA